MKFQIFSRDQIESYSLGEKHVVISISSPGDTPAELPRVKSRLDTLPLCFYDIDRKIEGYDYRLFSIKDAKKIIDFVEKYKDKVECIVVHCDAGISRSPAVAAAICKARGYRDDYFFKHYLPNRHVYNVLLSEMMYGKHIKRG